ncbi:MAG: hypothetical protein EOO06_00345 [Chitinophagaceae bacterium]|nr:MAG: hypothetical protein EOO06_00345 [Chitinophagaceae bacterium]
MPNFTIISRPSEFEPLHTNGIPFVVSADNYSLPEFKYYFKPIKIDVDAPYSETILGEYKVPPRPGDGYGYFSPHVVLKSQVRNTISFGGSKMTTTKTTPPTFTSSMTFFIAGRVDAQVNYKMEYGYEWNPSYRVTYMTMVGTGYYPSSGPYVGMQLTELALHFSGQTPDFKVGDVIHLSKSNKAADAWLDGKCYVTSVFSPTIITVDRYSWNTMPLVYDGDTGIVQFQQRKIGVIETGTQAHSYGGTGKLYAFNGTRQPYERGIGVKPLLEGNQYFLSNYYPKGGYTHYKEVFPDQHESVTALIDANFFIINRVRITLYNENYPSGAIAEYLLPSGIDTTWRRKIYQVSCGPADIKFITGHSMVGVKYYKFQLLDKNDGGETARGTIVRKIVSNCSIYQNVQIAFLNRRGGFDYWNFNMASRKNTKVDRQTYKRSLPWNHDVTTNNGIRQEVVLSTTVDEQYTVNTDWISEYDYNFLEELITSPEVYRIDGFGTQSRTQDLSGFKIDQIIPTIKVTPITIVDTSFSSKSSLNDKIFNMSITYRIAYDTILQNR